MDQETGIKWGVVIADEAGVDRPDPRLIVVQARTSHWGNIRR